MNVYLTFISQQYTVREQTSTPATAKATSLSKLMLLNPRCELFVNVYRYIHIILTCEEV